MRQLRVLQDGATYHVTSKINRGEMALKSAEIKRVFLDLVETAKKKFGFKLWNFTVMDNHIHFLIKPDKVASLSEIMQWVKCNFAKKWNKIHDTKGILWGGRFLSRIIRNEDDLSQTSDYIDETPVEKNLVKEAKKWKFGGLFHKRQRTIGLIDALPEGGLFSTADASASPG
jgi:putative transposase